METREYVDRSGRSPFAIWLQRLDGSAKLRILTSLERARAGNLSSTKSVGKGVQELRMDFGPGYRIYFGRDGKTWIILLGGGTKSRQQADIKAAQVCWQEYKARKLEE